AVPARNDRLAAGADGREVQARGARVADLVGADERWCAGAGDVRLLVDLPPVDLCTLGVTDGLGLRETGLEVAIGGGVVGVAAARRLSLSVADRAVDAGLAVDQALVRCGGALERGLDRLLGELGAFRVDLPLTAREMRDVGAGEVARHPAPRDEYDGDDRSKHGRPPLARVDRATLPWSFESPEGKKRIGAPRPAARSRREGCLISCAGGRLSGGPSPSIGAFVRDRVCRAAALRAFPPRGA